MARTNSSNSRQARLMLNITRAVVYVILIFLSVMCLFSFYMLIINSTRSNADLQGGFQLLPDDQFFVNLYNAWTDASIDIPRGMLNSFMLRYFVSNVSGSCYGQICGQKPLPQNLSEFLAGIRGSGFVCVIAS